ncbi:MAG: hypothetical protein P1U52_02895 [Porticoccaceae bacterium]|nr:hypothetical protein [Porticoccaceae bacterium]
MQVNEGVAKVGHLTRPVTVAGNLMSLKTIIATFFLSQKEGVNKLLSSAYLFM